MSEVSRASLVLVSFLGAGQALVLAIALVFRAVNRPANRVLAALLVAMAVYLGNGAYQAADLVARWPVFFRWAHPVPLLFGPLLFLYARLVTDERRRLRWRDALHLVPAVAVVLWSLPVYLLPGAEKAALFATMREGLVPALVATNLRVTLWLKLASGVTYTALTVHATLRHRRRIRAEYSTLDRISLDWLLLLVAASVLVWAIAVATQFVEPSGVVSPGTGDQLIALLMTLAVCTIGVRGMQQAPVRLVTDEDRTGTSTDVGVPAAVERSVHDDAPDTTTTPEQPAKTGRSDRSSITPGMSRALEHRLHAEMRDA
ncbi:MAG: hypothetical protein MUE41_13130, partial [Gemmatimonadaceae bacterium]|nr:hypothetical protein [Gemmatimonadaceae bacterium]